MPGVNGLPLSHRRKETPMFNNLELDDCDRIDGGETNPSSTAKKCSAIEDCCRTPEERGPSSTVKDCSVTGLQPNRQRREMLSSSAKECEAFPGMSVRSVSTSSTQSECLRCIYT